jgi:hypothetical protein
MAWSGHEHVGLHIAPQFFREITRAGTQRRNPEFGAGQDKRRSRLNEVPDPPRIDHVRDRLIGEDRGPREFNGMVQPASGGNAHAVRTHAVTQQFHDFAP